MKTIIKTILGAVALCALAACATTGTTVTPPPRPSIVAPSAVAMASCQLPVTLPPGKMTQKDIEKYWGLDRAHQLDCLRRHKLLVDYINKRDAGLAGSAK